jgi:hypothetical protein
MPRRSTLWRFTHPLKFLSILLPMFLNFARTATFRRLLVMVLGALAILLKNKLGIEIDPAALDAFAGIIMSYIIGSNAKDAVVAITAMKTEAAARAAAEVGGIEAAKVVFSEQPKE